ncbi:MAG: hypothetical protein ACI8RD_011585, partial [Bacillariaceae sp.]
DDFLDLFRIFFSALCLDENGAISILV